MADTTALVLPSALPSTCQPGRYRIGGAVVPDDVLVEISYSSGGARVDVSYSFAQLQATLSPHLPTGYQPGDPILIATWEAVKAANPTDAVLCRFCDGMIRAGRGEAWAPLVIQSENTI